MANLADYLDELAVKPGRGFGTVPSMPLVLTVPLQITDASVALATALRSSLVDTPMWTLDARWAPTAKWASMKSCIAQHNYGGDYDSQPWDAPGIVAAGGCKNWAGTSQPPSCDWGFWRLPTCSLETATSLSFQFSRYIWAQGRMQDHLRLRPVPGGPNYTTAAVAADWAWKAAQLISVLLWSTNVRFDSGYGVVRQVDADLVTAGLLLQRSVRSWDPRRNWTGHERDESARNPVHYDGALPQVPPPMDGTWRSISRVWELLPTVFNYLGNDPVAPVDQNGFSPAFGRVWNDPLLRFGPSDASPMVTRPLASMVDISVDDDLSMLRRWFALNWLGGPPAWVKTPQKVYQATRTHQRPVPDWTRSERTLWTTSPQWIVADLAEQLRHYSDPTHTYFDWMNTALRTFDINTPTATNTIAGQDFVASKHDLLANVANAATQARALAMSGSSGGGDAAVGAMVVQTGIALVSTIATMVLPIVGLFFTAFGAITDFLKNLVTGLIAGGPAPCAAFPFIRVMSPDGPCTIATSDITASILGISSNAAWPVAIGGLTRSFTVDGKSFTVAFTAADTTADLVARRINAAAALVGLGQVASVRSGQVHVEGRDPGAGPARATGGTAAALRFPGPTTTPSSPGPAMTTCPNGTLVPAGTACPPAASKPSAIPWLVAAAVAARFLLG